MSQRSVAHATLNRVSSSDFPDTVCGVVRQGGERPLGRCQFSWWCDGRSDEPRDEAAWCRALGVARDALAGRSRDPTGGALYFHARTVAPKWASRLHRIARIGAHVYYR